MTLQTAICGLTVGLFLLTGCSSSGVGGGAGGGAAGGAGGSGGGSAVGGGTGGTGGGTAGGSGGGTAGGSGGGTAGGSGGGTAGGAGGGTAGGSGGGTAGGSGGGSAGGSGGGTAGGSGGGTATVDAGMTVVIAAAGDISTTSIGDQKKTSDLIVDGGYDAVLVLGDNQYENGELANYMSYYDPTWGRFKGITYPSVGNHEYNTTNAAGYYAYFGARAGDPTKGYYSFDLGEWHLIALNSNCSFVSCAANSAQVAWLKADLMANTKKCILAFWHHPRFNSGYTHGNDSNVAPFWDALYAAGADFVLNGHDHIYERFNPQTPAQAADATNGIREWVVGTGGRALYGTLFAQPNSAVRNSNTFGVLKLTLKPTSYDWKFMPIAGSTFTDSGSANCH